ncbi:MAG: diaminopimelate epimerase [Desulfocapsaceae bacterium]|jgi:diaminopimelate epimerase|nr:diaminopimelate epimerase [Desulfocapsaceae bacterium]
MEIQFPIPITKMNGAGNDFVVIDHRQGFIPERLHAQFAQAVCRRSFSVGADGLILIEDSRTEDFSWRFYNSDGSVAEMCGNGARCAARYAYRRNIADKQMKFETIAGTIEAEIIGEQEHVSIRMTEPGDFEVHDPILLGDERYVIHSINTGVPHAVVFVEADNSPVVEWGRLIRYHRWFEPAGTNVNFVRVTGDGDLHVRTYERGVEGETLACGTGAVASAIIAADQGLVSSPTYVLTGGGEQLVVQFEMMDGAASDVYLQGAARIVFEGNLLAEALL